MFASSRYETHAFRNKLIEGKDWDSSFLWLSDVVVDDDGGVEVDGCCRGTSVHFPSLLTPPP